jgi:hypothetical protein
MPTPAERRILDTLKTFTMLPNTTQTEEDSLVASPEFSPRVTEASDRATNTTQHATHTVVSHAKRCGPQTRVTYIPRSRLPLYCKVDQNTRESRIKVACLPEPSGRQATRRFCREGGRSPRQASQGVS